MPPIDIKNDLFCGVKAPLEGMDRNKKNKFHKYWEKNMYHFWFVFQKNYSFEIGEVERKKLGIE